MDRQPLSKPPRERPSASAAGGPDPLAVRVGRYLRACGIEDDAAVEVVTARVLGNLQRGSAGRNEARLTASAIFEAQRVIERALMQPGGATALVDTTREALAQRVAVLSGSVEGWSQGWLADGSHAATLVEASAVAAPRPLPPEAPMAMEPQRIELRTFPTVRLRRREQTPAESEPVARIEPASWRYRVRRLLLGGLVGATTVAAAVLMLGALQSDGLSPLEILLLVLYALLISWVAISFWTAVIGFLVIVCGQARSPLARTAGDSPPRTALVMPIYNEDPERVFAGLRAMWQSLCEQGLDDGFEAFVLSDTQDPDIWVEEEREWYRLCLDLDAHGRVFYRNRAQNIARKSGNIAEFCRRWGGRYRYMIVLDADSIMRPETLREMVQIMESNPRVALVQAPPVPVNRASLFSRIIQFASTAYGPLYFAGLAFWQGGESNFWGHNAIIRVAAFAACCGLPRLPGKEPFGGEILSHDFVEAGLLRRAGWQVWLAPELRGSYEEIPPTLIDYAKRDRRWCQGNLQHFRLIFARNFHPVTRLHLAMGVMSYVSSPLWLLFLVVTGVEAYSQALAEPIYFFGENLRPQWPVSYQVEMMTVLLVTLSMLFAPKLMALLTLAVSGERRRGHGGVLRAALSTLLETVFSVLTAPVLMLFQSRFVWSTLLNRHIDWPAQRRADRRTGFGEAFRAHFLQTLLGLTVALFAALYLPLYFWWVTPVLLGMVVSIPLSIWSSSPELGAKARAARLFVTPQESHPSRALLLVDERLARAAATAGNSAFATGREAALRDPHVNALHLCLLPERVKSRRERHRLEGLVMTVLEEGAGSLSALDARGLLSDRTSVQSLHARLWARATRG